ncbi:SDR family oxidoreductase [Kutzneria sp. CA-103260]|uniref:SDR family oxidoreductase n=1 Tax=Kutzneria sp. CA-103260 TaxID=2802641 RepID=UPI001BA45641|nr:SDR family oxidoreductase [Kutzneria sp. CA-103260]QUQ72435.1 short-chain dehydrogenase [Kutzneria sp. CA-103260]
MDIATSTALVTGANRGLGRALAAELLSRGAKVYAAARNPDSVDLPGAVPLALDITDPASVAAAAKATGDVTLLINNAGISTSTPLLTGELAKIQLEMNTHYFGTLDVIRAFVPQIEARGGGAVFNVLSVLSWCAADSSTGAYSAAKGAEWQLTNALRLELAPRGIRVSGLHVGYIDTEMAAHVTAPKANPADIAKLTVEGIAADDYEVIADDLTRKIRAGLSVGVGAIYPNLV